MRVSSHTNKAIAANPHTTQKTTKVMMSPLSLLTLPAPDTYYGTAKSHVDLTRIQNIIDGTSQPDNPDVCSDFAERLHNDAEIDVFIPDITHIISIDFYLGSILIPDYPNWWIINKNFNASVLKPGWNTLKVKISDMALVLGTSITSVQI